MPIEPLQLIISKIDDMKKDNEDQHNRIMNRVYKIDTATDLNTEHRIQWKAKIDVWRWIIAALGVGNIGNLLYMWLTNYQH